MLRILECFNEGIWSPYLLAEDNQAVAYRTFFPPDPERPFALVAVVAIDLTQTQLHFVLGSQEPSLPDGPRGRGQIPAEHKDTGILLATFNGGFKATHGQFGAMANGVEALPPQDGLATVALYDDGQIKNRCLGHRYCARRPSHRLATERPIDY